MKDEHNKAVTNRMKKTKYYRIQAKVDLNAVCHNVDIIKSSLDKDTKLMVIIKADAYGHGAVPIAEAIDDKVDAYGVAIIEEAIELRKAGIKKPILILGYTPIQAFALIVANDVTQTVFQYHAAKALSLEAKKQNKKAKIHIKIDTGMNRIGFPDNTESINEIKKIANLSNLETEGIFTHYAKADESNKTSTYKQFKRFMDFIEQLEKEGINIPIKHASNSAGIIDFDQSDLNMVRCGVATYGIYPSEDLNNKDINLKAAMTLESHIIFLKEVGIGEGVSYGSTFITKRKTRIATIPVGYADGYSRNLSNKGHVIIHGQYAPIIGRVCMDQFMVDVTDIENVRQGDKVTLLGSDGQANISVEELSNWSYSFPYELMCTIGKRIPRVYLDIEDK